MSQAAQAVERMVREMRERNARTRRQERRRTMDEQAGTLGIEPEAETTTAATPDSSPAAAPETQASDATGAATGEMAMAKKRVGRPRKAAKAGTAKRASARKPRAESADKGPRGVVRAGKQGSLVLTARGIDVVVPALRLALKENVFDEKGEADARHLLARAESRQ